MNMHFHMPYLPFFNIFSLEGKKSLPGKILAYHNAVKLCEPKSFYLADSNDHTALFLITFDSLGHKEHTLKLLTVTPRSLSV